MIYDPSINIQQYYLIQMTDPENKNIRPFGILALCRLPRETLKLLIHTTEYIYTILSIFLYRNL